MKEIWNESRARMRNAVCLALYSAIAVIVILFILLSKFC
jgi:predicted nucleic acid-binding Zn ribbon protein